MVPIRVRLASAREAAEPWRTSAASERRGADMGGSECWCGDFSRFPSSADVMLLFPVLLFSRRRCYSCTKRVTTVVMEGLRSQVRTRVPIARVTLRFSKTYTMLALRQQERNASMGRGPLSTSYNGRIIRRRRPPNTATKGDCGERERAKCVCERNLPAWSSPPLTA